MKGQPDKRAAILCRHCFGGQPILIAIRDTPSRTEDSGWQFLCGDGKHDSQLDAMVLSVDEVISLEPSLGEFIEMPVNTILTRPDITSHWLVSQA